MQTKICHLSGLGTIVRINKGPRVDVTNDRPRIVLVADLRNLGGRDESHSQKRAEREDPNTAEKGSGNRNLGATVKKYLSYLISLFESQNFVIKGLIS